MLGCHIAFIRAAEHAGHVTAHTHAVLFGGVHDGHEAFQALADGAIDIALGKRFRGRREHRHLFDPRRQGVFKSAQVGRQGPVDHARLALDLGKDFGRAGHLRHPFGRDETADFYIADAGGGQGVHQLHLGLDADGLGFVLQAVARADFNQAYMAWE